MTILLVEDDDALRQLAARVLRTAGYCVREAVNGEDALRAVDAHEEIDLLMTDVVMPKMGGLELGRRLCARDPDLRIVYMSGYSEDALKNQYAFPPDAAWISKPFSPGMLLHEARIGLNGRRSDNEGPVPA